MSNNEIQKIIDTRVNWYAKSYSYLLPDYDVHKDEDEFDIRQDLKQDCWLGIMECCRNNNKKLEELVEKTIIAICCNRLNNYIKNIKSDVDMNSDFNNDPVCATSLNLQRWDYLLDDIEFIISKIYMPSLFKEHSKERKYICYKLISNGLIQYDSLEQIDKDELINPKTDEEVEILRSLGYSISIETSSSTTVSSWISKKRYIHDVITKYIEEFKK